MKIYLALLSLLVSSASAAPLIGASDIQGTIISGTTWTFTSPVIITTSTSVGMSSPPAATVGESLNVYGGVITSSSVVPTPSACTGQSFAPVMSATSSNQAGQVVMGGCSGVTVTFSKPWHNISSCVVNAGSNNVAVEVSALSNTAFTGIWTGGLSNIYYICFGEP